MSFQTQWQSYILSKQKRTRTSLSGSVHLITPQFEFIKVIVPGVCLNNNTMEMLVLIYQEAQAT